jgi:hypothetical protein
MIDTDWEEFVVNSDASHVEFTGMARALFDKHKYLTWKFPKIGPERSLSQNALFHVWARKLVAFYLKKDEKQVTEGELEGCKRMLKRRFYKDNRKDWLTVEILDPMSGQKRMDFRSSRKYSTQQMWEFMFW